MAHGIRNNEVIYTGQRESVWHRLGEYTGEEVITVDRLRGVVGIPVEKVSVRYNRPVAGGTDSVETESLLAFLTVRMDTGEELASVGAQYTVVPHDVALVQTVKPILDAGLAHVSAAGLLYGGVGGWTCLQWNLDKMDPIIRDVYRDEIQAFGLCLSWHNGTANQYANIAERAVCKNTIDAGLASGTLKTKVIHRKNAVARSFDAAQETFQHVVAHHAEMAAKYRLLQHKKLTRQEWIDAVMTPAAPDPRKAADFNPQAPRAELVVDRWREKVKRIHDLWSHGTGHTGDASAWEAYNGLVESLDHDTETWKARSAENRALSLTDGPLAQIRTTVFNKLVALAS